MDLKKALRRFKPEKIVVQLPERDPSQLRSYRSLRPSIQTKILLDTNVLIKYAAGELPGNLPTVLETAILYQCSICVSEICVGLAHRNVNHPNWKKECDYWDAIFSAFQPSRVLEPDTDIWLEAGLLAGIIARVQNYQQHQMKAALHDAAIYLVAAKNGVPVLTANRKDFDFIQQLTKRGQFYWF